MNNPAQTINCILSGRRDWPASPRVRALSPRHTPLHLGTRTGSASVPTGVLVAPPNASQPCHNKKETQLCSVRAVIGSPLACPMAGDSMEGTPLRHREPQRFLGSDLVATFYWYPTMSNQIFLIAYVFIGLGLRGGHDEWSKDVRLIYFCLFPLHSALFLFLSWFSRRRNYLWRTISHEPLSLILYLWRTLWTPLGLLMLYLWYFFYGQELLGF